MSEPGFRNKLATERTRLSNERTLLAYIRTALALTVGGAVLLQFFADDRILFALAWVLLVAGGATLLIGAYRFSMARRRLRRH